MSCGIGSRLSRGSKLSAGIGLRLRFLGFHDKMDFLDFLVIFINSFNPKLSCPLSQYFPDFLFYFRYLVGVLVYNKCGGQTCKRQYKNTLESRISNDW